MLRAVVIYRHFALRAIRPAKMHESACRRVRSRCHPRLSLLKYRSPRMRDCFCKETFQLPYLAGTNLTMHLKSSSSISGMVLSTARAGFNRSTRPPCTESLVSRPIPAKGVRSWRKLLSRFTTHVQFSTEQLEAKASTYRLYSSVEAAQSLEKA